MFAGQSLSLSATDGYEPVFCSQFLKATPPPASIVIVLYSFKAMKTISAFQFLAATPQSLPRLVLARKYCEVIQISTQ